MHLIHQLMDPATLLAQFGDAFFYLALVIVFIECGLFFPILPGDTLLFAVGMFTHQGAIGVPLGVSLLALFLAAFAGNVVGYEIGRAVGSKLYERDGRILKRKHFDRTIAFFDRYGRRALVIGRFVPIVRTFITVVAGVGQMPRRIFLTWSAVGAVGWVVLITLAGYFLGGVAAVRNNIEVVVLVMLAVSVIPMAIEAIRHWHTKRRHGGDDGGAASDPGQADVTSAK